MSGKIRNNYPDEDNDLNKLRSLPEAFLNGTVD